MSANTNIEWTDATWNPIRGCSRVSEGCRNCYAEKVAYRFSGTAKPYEGLVRINSKGERVPEWNGHVEFVEKHLLDPLKWAPVRWKEYVENDALNQFSAKERPRRIFVNSMSDLFHENVPDEWIDRIFAVMALCPQHVFQVLTKRPERMLAYLSASGVRRAIALQANIFMRSNKRAANSDALAHVFLWGNLEHAEVGEYANYLAGIADRCWPLPNVWLGVSVENQKAADKRIPLLLQTPAAVRFISAEPLLGPVNLNRIEVIDAIDRSDPDEPVADGYCIDAANGEAFDDENGELSTKPDGEVPMERGLDWVIVGGESGPGARPMHPDWARSLRDQCQAADVPFFFKQWGAWAPTGPIHTLQLSVCAEDGWYGQCTHAALEAHYGEAHRGQAACPPFQAVYRVGKHAAGAMLDGREWREFPPEVQSCQP